MEKAGRLETLSTYNVAISQEAEAEYEDVTDDDVGLYR
jgi:hypothetical protein